MKNLFYTLFVILLISSCNKAKIEEDNHCLENCIVFTGKIIDTPFNSNLSNVELKFYYYEPESEGSSLLRPPVYLGTKKTEKDGTYKFEFNGEAYPRNGYFTIMGKEDGYFAYPTTAELETYAYIWDDEIQYNTPIIKNINLFKKAELELKIKTENKLAFENFDIHYGTNKWHNGELEGQKGYTIGIDIPFNQRIDTLIRINVPVGLKSYIQWHGYDNLESPVVEGIDSLISKDGDKSFYEIVL